MLRPGENRSSRPRVGEKGSSRLRLAVKRSSRLRLAVKRFGDVRDFLHCASSWLHRNEAEHNVLLGITEQLRRNDHPFQEPIYLATVEDNNQIVGCAFCTLPWPMGVTNIPLCAVPMLASDVAEVIDRIPSVMGPESVCVAFAKVWTEQFGGTWTITMRHRLHSLETVNTARLVAAGHLRVAEPSDQQLVTEWLALFLLEVGIKSGNATDMAARMIRDRSIYLWEDGEPRTMLAALAQTARGVRIGYVFTPHIWRNCGYATTAVTSLSSQLLASGRTFCCLYTNVDNPTSNAVYAKIGYRPLCDAVEIALR